MVMIAIRELTAMKASNMKPHCLQSTSVKLLELMPTANRKKLNMVIVK